MKKTILLFFLIFSSQTAFTQNQIDYYTYVEASNVGSVQSILLKTLGDEFRIRGDKKIWQKKELNYMYRISFKNGKLRIYYKGTHDEIEEKIKYMYEEIKLLP